MKIAIITSGRLPVPATKGGAVETKLDYILDFNAQHHLHDITVYSVKPNRNIDKNTPENHYIHFTLDSFWAKIGRNIYKYLNKSPYYTNYMEYFLHKCIMHIKRRRFDCIIIANRPGFAMKLHKAVKTPIVNQINNDYISPDSSQASVIKEASSLIITCSDFLNRQACKVECSKETPIVTVHNGIDIKRFADAKPIDRSVLGMKKDDFVIFFSGRLTKEKGILELIQAFKQIKSIPNLKLIIAGASFYGKDSKTTPYVEELQQEAESIKEQVVFTGFVDYNDMPSYLKTANVIIVPSLWEEPFGLTVLEAMAAGVPLIASRCGGIPEVCEDTAILIERDHIVQHIINAIQQVYDNPEESKQMAQRAQTRSWSFDKDIFSSNYLKTVSQFFSDRQAHPTSPSSR
jgi:glycosyltransferase involved in cell wall biosynthesis